MATLKTLCLLLLSASMAVSTRGVPGVSMHCMLQSTQSFSNSGNYPTVQDALCSSIFFALPTAK